MIAICMSFVICDFLYVTCYLNLFISETCYYLQKLVSFARCCTSRNFFSSDSDIARIFRSLNTPISYYIYWSFTLYFDFFQLVWPLFECGLVQWCLFSFGKSQNVQPWQNDLSKLGLIQANKSKNVLIWRNRENR